MNTAQRRLLEETPSGEEIVSFQQDMAKSVLVEQSSSSFVIHALTLNCWGVPIASYREERMHAIGNRLAQSHYDIVALQEVWFDVDWNIIRHALKNNPYTQLKHAHRFKSGAIGSGIVILSKYPIVEATFQCFNSSGKFYKFWHGDAYAGKGISHAVVETPRGNVDVYSTHTHASYDETRIIHEEYHGVRLAQLLQLAKYVKNTSKSQFALCMGDLNAGPDSTEMKMFLDISTFEDAFVNIEGNTSRSNPGYTCTLENIFNTSGCCTSLIFPSPDTIFPSRLDYIFYKFSTGKNRSWKAVKVSHCEVTFDTNDVKVADKHFLVPYSDHFGVEASFEMISKDANFEEKRESEVNAGEEKDVSLMIRSIEILDHSIKEADLRRRIFLVSKWLMLVLTVVVEALFFLLIDDSLLQRCLVIIFAVIMCTLIILFFFLDKSMVPAEISSLEQARGEIGLVWRIWSSGRLSLAGDEGVRN